MNNQRRSDLLVYSTLDCATSFRQRHVKFINVSNGNANRLVYYVIIHKAWSKEFYRRGLIQTGYSSDRWITASSGVAGTSFLTAALCICFPRP